MSFNISVGFSCLLIQKGVTRLYDEQPKTQKVDHKASQKYEIFLGS